MQLIPVLDLMNSTVVRGVAGQRAAYQPIQSVLCSRSEPLAVATAIRQAFGSNTYYVADLDAILRDEPNEAIIESLCAAKFQLWIDTGVRDAYGVETVLAAGAEKVIIGLETWPSLAALELLVRQVGPERLIFSLDLKNGQCVRGFRDIVSTEPIDIAASVIEAGIQQLIVLDVAQVGVSQGVNTIELCHAIRSFAPTLSLITGGGIRNVGDLKTLESEGVDGALVASAIHSGMISPEEWSLFGT